MIVLQILVGVVGAFIVFGTVLSAIRTFVLPRAAPVLIGRIVFLGLRSVFNLFARPSRPYADRDRIMALYGPLALLALATTWVSLVGAGYTVMFWAVGVRPLSEAVITSGSSLLTLGFERPAITSTVLLAFSEAALGLLLIALLITYLPVIYAAFTRREISVTLLEAFAGSPPSSSEFLLRHYRIGGLTRLDDNWLSWQTWFADVEESHTSIAALCFFRSPQPDRSWVTAAGCTLDAAALHASCLDMEREPEAELCIRAGYLCLRHIANFFAIPYDSNPAPDDPISIRRAEFDEVWQKLAREGLPMKPEPDQAWRAFAGWRVNYDAVLVALARLTMAPPAPWTGDRPAPDTRPPLLGGVRSGPARRSDMAG
ncbi:MAG: hypothetical protein H0U04_04455 [Rubrobacter sp.]|nr:hypothetical protein [Rubrobacter sp.]